MSLSGKPQLTTAAPIANDGFWPDLSVGELVNNYRIPPEYADKVIETGLVAGMININNRLERVKSALSTAGSSSLEAYTNAHDDSINDEPLLITCYKNACYSWAKHWLLWQFNSLNRKQDAENAAKEAPEMAQFWLDEAQANIATLFHAILPDVEVSTKASVFVGLM
jgi:hypothetical protein